MTKRTPPQTEAKETAKGTQEKSARILSIDRFRGFAVFCMIFFQFMANFDNLGFFTRISSHNKANGILLLPGLTIADVILPMFMFAIGLTYILSFKKRVEKYGKKATYIHFVTRYLGLIGLGSIMSAINKLIDGSFTGVDYTFYILTGIVALCGIAYLITLIPKIKNLNKYMGWAVMIGLSALGLFNIGVALRDFIVLNGNIPADCYGYWVTLQTIGFAGLVTLCFINLKTWWRLIPAAVIFTGFTIFHELGSNMTLLDVIADGGFLGGFSWASMLMFATVIAELYYKNKKYLYISLGALAALGVAAFFAFKAVNMGSVSPSYVIITLAVSTAIFIIFDLFNFLTLKFDFLAIWGKNPILMYMLEFGFVGSITQFAPESMIAEAPIWLAIIMIAVVTAILTVIAWLLSRKEKHIKF